MTGQPEKRRAFSLAEILIVLLVLGTLAGGLGLVTGPRRQTAMREADRAMRWLYNVTLRSDRSGQSFKLDVVPQRLKVTWGRTEKTECMNVTEGCSFSFYKTSMTRTYEPQWGSLTPAATIEVRGTDNDVYYVVISGQGRLRISPVPPNPSE